MAPFTLQIYQTNLGLPSDVSTPLAAYIRTSPVTRTLIIEGSPNIPPAGITTINSNVPIRVTRKRAYGITARHIVLARLGGTAPNQYNIYRKIVIYDPILFYEAISALNNTFSYEGQTDWALVGAQNETYHLFSDSTAA
jgi:hypothetical protein